MSFVLWVVVVLFVCLALLWRIQDENRTLESFEEIEEELIQSPKIPLETVPSGVGDMAWVRTSGVSLYRATFAADGLHEHALRFGGVVGVSEVKQWRAWVVLDGRWSVSGREALQLDYDPMQVDYRRLLEMYRDLVDPFALSHQWWWVWAVSWVSSTAIYYHSKPQKLMIESFLHEMDVEQVYGLRVETVVVPYTTFEERV